jgi:hypothetical protein
MNNELVDDGTSSPMKRRRNNATNSKQYFKLNTDGRNYCQYGDCTKSYAAKTSTTNLMYHLSSEHEVFLMENDLGIEKETSSTNSKETCPLKLASAVGPLQQQKSNSKNQERFTDLLVEFIVEDLQPFHIVMSRGFRKFINALEPKYIMPDEKTVKQKVLEKYANLKPKVEELTMKSDSLKSWTSDGWSSNVLDPYLMLTTHFIDKDFNYIELAYDFTLFPHPHDQFNSSEKLFEVI